MLWKPVLILSLSFLVSGSQTPQLKTSGERQSGSLPVDLTENETQIILKERSPKPHVETALKISNSRLASALKLIEEEQYQPAVQDVDLYAGLIIYADAYTRKLPGSENKDRSFCLKKVEQSIFKQSRNVDALLRGLPLQYREHADERIEQVKKIRLRAINDLLGDGRMIKTADE